jgi:hypothetical protein
MLKTLTAAALLSFGLAGSALAASCKDAKGKFTKCPVAAAVHCKDAKGKFVKCSAPGAIPVK